MIGKERLCLALDEDSKEEARRLIEELADYVGVFKIGFQLFVAEGPSIIDVVRGAGGDVFLDLKFHDIPATVAHASRVATGMGVKMFNIHASGGKDMMEASVEATRQEAEREGVSRPKVLAVTVLTSIDSHILQNQIKVVTDLEAYVVYLAQLAQSAGADGVVASPKETRLIRKVCGENFFVVTPGIRLPGSPPDDQKRTMTPGEAIQAGADCLVIGRPIRNASNRTKVAQEILDSIRVI